MFCTGDATAILMRNAASAGRERETEIDLRNLNTVESLHTLETENGHCGEGVHYGEVEVNKYDNFFEGVQRNTLVL